MERSQVVAAFGTRIRAGDPGSLDRLVPIVYDVPRRLAATVR